MKNIIRKCSNKVIYYILRLNKFRPYMADYFGKEIISQFFDNPEEASLSKRLWALKKGFLVDKINAYGLTNENYKDYISDYEYFRMYPLNNHYSIWIDDKLTLKYTLNKYNEFLPEYYCEIQNDGYIQYLMDWPKDIPKNSSSEIICQLLQKMRCLAAKKTTGAAGEGFYKIVYDEGDYFVNDIKYSYNDFIVFLKQCKGYLFTEYIKQCSFYNEVYPGAAHTLRIQTLKYNKNVSCCYAFVRWGGERNRFSVGHVGDSLTAVVDVETGIIDHGFYIDDNKQWLHTTKHPETGVSVNTKVPKWEFILEKCLEIHNYMNELEYIGFDVIITEDSFKICEINSHTGIRGPQHECPLLKNEKCADFFSKHVKRK